MKDKITRKVGEEIREKCINSTKARVVKNDNYEKKDYLVGKVSLNETKKILMTRMNMKKIPGNYRGKDTQSRKTAQMR